MSSTLPRDLVTGVILAGGRAVRLHGADKGLALWQGRPLAAHVRDALAPQVASLVVSANRNLEQYAALGLTVVTDAQPDCGPLAGILAGLEHARTPWVLVVPCDIPRLPADLAARLSAAARGARAAYARSAADAYYTVCLLQRGLAADLGAALARGVRAVHEWLAEIGAAAALLPAPLADLNTPQALAAAERA